MRARRRESFSEVEMRRITTMQSLSKLPGKSKNNGAAPPSKRHDPAAVVSFPTAQPKKRKSLFARQIWSVEHKPSFVRSSI